LDGATRSLRAHGWALRAARGQAPRSNLAPVEAPWPEIASSPAAPRNGSANMIEICSDIYCGVLPWDPRHRLLAWNIRQGAAPGCRELPMRSGTIRPTSWWYRNTAAAKRQCGYMRRCRSSARHATHSHRRQGVAGFTERAPARSTDRESQPTFGRDWRIVEHSLCLAVSDFPLFASVSPRPMMRKSADLEKYGSRRRGWNRRHHSCGRDASSIAELLIRPVQGAGACRLSLRRLPCAALYPQQSVKYDKSPLNMC
jgi:hypothetical protein